jgi:2-iminobutanoate/2-iminopropanoate deaminase
MIRTIFTTEAPAPAGHYSQATVHNGTVYVAGQLAIDNAGNKLAGAPIEVQTELVFRNIEAILHAAGSSLDRVLSVTIYVSDIENWEKINQTYMRIFDNTNLPGLWCRFRRCTTGLGWKCR